MLKHMTQSRFRLGYPGAAASVDWSIMQFHRKLYLIILLVKSLAEKIFGYISSLKLWGNINSI